MIMRRTRLSFERSLKTRLAGSSHHVTSSTWLSTRKRTTISLPAVSDLQMLSCSLMQLLIYHLLVGVRLGLVPQHHVMHGSNRFLTANSNESLQRRHSTAFYQHARPRRSAQSSPLFFNAPRVASTGPAVAISRTIQQFVAARRPISTPWAIKRTQLIFVCNFVKNQWILIQFHCQIFKMNGTCDDMNFTHLT